MVAFGQREFSRHPLFSMHTSFAGLHRGFPENKGNRFLVANFFYLIIVKSARAQTFLIGKFFCTSGNLSQARLVEFFSAFLRLCFCVNAL